MARVLVVDDSPLMRQFMCQLLGSEPDIELATAQDGRDALRQLHSFKPDVITLDINMPGMDGLSALAHIMTERPTPVVIVSSLAGRAATVTLEALAMGAVDYIAKPGGTISLGMDEVGRELRRKVRMAANARIDVIPAALPLDEALPILSQRQRRAVEEDVREESAAFRAGIAASPRPRPARARPAREARRTAPEKRDPTTDVARPRIGRATPAAATAAKPATPVAARLAEAATFKPAATMPAGPDVALTTPAPIGAGIDPVPRSHFNPGYGDPEGLVLVGVSTGGPRTLPQILRALSPRLGWAIVICQHMPDQFTETFARRLDELCPLPVREVREEMPVKPGHVYVARGGFDLSFTRREGRLWVQNEPERKGCLWHPSVERMVESALQHMKPHALIGVMLTGMGYDGADAMTRLKNLGGRTVAESRDSAVVYGMPKELIERGGASQVAAAADIPRVLHEWLHCST